MTWSQTKARIFCYDLKAQYGAQDDIRASVDGWELAQGTVGVLSDRPLALTENESLVVGFWRQMLVPGTFFSMPDLHLADVPEAPSTCDSIVAAVAAPSAPDDDFVNHVFFQVLKGRPANRVLHRSHLSCIRPDALAALRYSSTRVGGSWRLARLGQEAIHLRTWCARDAFQHVLQHLRVWMEPSVDSQLALQD